MDEHRSADMVGLKHWGRRNQLRDLWRRLVHARGTSRVLNYTHWCDRRSRSSKGETACQDGLQE